ncbi:DUF6928 family protein [Streptomyces canus]|uniref:DUF6928 family protein n=1 Tax=Streptomyces canus TaxID=58343 RepID=UPI00358F0EF3
MGVLCERRRLWGETAGARTGLLAYGDGEVPGLLRQVGTADLARTSDMTQRLYPDCEIEPSEGAELWDAVYPPNSAPTGSPSRPSTRRSPPSATSSSPPGPPGPRSTAPSPTGTA